MRTESHCIIRGISSFQRDVFPFLILIVSKILNIEKQKCAELSSPLSSHNYRNKSQYLDSSLEASQ